jgi:hypothetical protein
MFPGFMRARGRVDHRAGPPTIIGPPRSAVAPTGSTLRSPRIILTSASAGTAWAGTPGTPGGHLPPARRRAHLGHAPDRLGTQRSRREARGGGTRISVPLAAIGEAEKVADPQDPDRVDFGFSFDRTYARQPGLWRQTRHPGVQRSAAVRPAPRPQQRPRGDAATAGGQHTAILVRAIAAAAPSAASPADLPTRVRRPRDPLRRQPPQAPRILCRVRHPATLLANALAPRILRYLARTGFVSQQTRQHREPTDPVNLWEPADGLNGRDFGAHGRFDATAHRRDWQLWASHHHTL